MLLELSIQVWKKRTGSMVSDVTALSWERLLGTDRGMVCGEYMVWVKDGN